MFLSGHQPLLVILNLGLLNTLIHTILMMVERIKKLKLDELVEGVLIRGVKSTAERLSLADHNLTNYFNNCSISFRSFGISFLTTSQTIS